jgi:hypothetical protein
LHCPICDCAQNRIRPGSFQSAFNEQVRWLELDCERGHFWRLVADQGDNDHIFKGNSQRQKVAPQETFRQRSIFLVFLILDLRSPDGV